MGFEKALGAVKVIKDQIQYRSQSLLNLARDYFSEELIRQSERWTNLLFRDMREEYNSNLVI